MCIYTHLVIAQVFFCLALLIYKALGGSKQSIIQNQNNAIDNRIPGMYVELNIFS
jgi:hypothetical protein